jgi:DNA-binding FadR family transcriptional regulator
MGVASDRIMASPGQLFELLTFRRLIEPEAAALAAGRIGPEDLAVITDCIARMREERPVTVFRLPLGPAAVIALLGLFWGARIVGAEP